LCGQDRCILRGVQLAKRRVESTGEGRLRWQGAGCGRARRTTRLIVTRARGASKRRDHSSGPSSREQARLLRRAAPLSESGALPGGGSALLRGTSSTAPLRPFPSTSAGHPPAVPRRRLAVLSFETPAYRAVLDIGLSDVAEDQGVLLRKGWPLPQSQPPTSTGPRPRAAACKHRWPLTIRAAADRPQELFAAALLRRCSDAAAPVDAANGRRCWRQSARLGRRGWRRRRLPLIRLEGPSRRRTQARPALAVEP
jgi:hypothetical protein